MDIKIKKADLTKSARYAGNLSEVKGSLYLAPNLGNVYFTSTVEVAGELVAGPGTHIHSPVDFLVGFRILAGGNVNAKRKIRASSIRTRGSIVAHSIKSLEEIVAGGSIQAYRYVGSGLSLTAKNTINSPKMAAGLCDWLPLLEDKDKLITCKRLIGFVVAGKLLEAEKKLEAVA